MAAPQSPESTARFDRLERRLGELAARVAELERVVMSRSDHPVDREAVRGKVTFDWQD